MKRLGCLLLALVLLTGCGAGRTEAKRYEATFLDLFDTVTTVVGYAESEEAFRQTAQTVHDELETYHRLFDIYNEYPDMNNLKTVNDRAGQEAVAVNRKILDLLLFCRDMEQTTGGMVNVAMGSVLSLWHEARSEGVSLPDGEALQAAAAHTDLENMILDTENGTVRFADPALKLDVGAVAKGYAAEQVCRTLPAGLMVSVGGNVCCTGSKPDGGSWGIGLQDPDGEGYLCVVQVEQTSVVTSGDYQRYYTVDGVRYHHIIDPQTRMPADKWRAVTVICADSGVADALSTALFLLPQAEGQKLLDQFGAEAMWLDGGGNRYYSPGFEGLMKK